MVIDSTQSQVYPLMTPGLILNGSSISPVISGVDPNRSPWQARERNECGLNLPGGG
jgi:hypothetical protein